MVIVLSRHAGPADSFLLLHEVMSWKGRRPRIVAKAALQLDPALDILLNRLPNRFIVQNPPPGSDTVSTTWRPGDRDDQRRRVRGLPRRRQLHRGPSDPRHRTTSKLLLLRIFAVSGYNWNAAFAVSTTLGVEDGLALVFGSFMAEHLMVALLLVLVLPLLVSTYLWSPNGRRPVVVLPADLGLLTLVALTVSFHTWWLPVATAAVLAMFVLVRRLPPQSVVRRASTAVTARAGWVAAMGALLAAVVVQTPWVPRERIETKSGTITGYVLSVDSGYLNVLTEDHEFVILISGDVRSRH